MKNNARYPQYTTMTAYALFPEITGLDIKEETFHDFAHMAVDKIGHNVDICKLKLEVPEDGRIYLPCEVTTIESVTDNVHFYDIWDAGEYDGDAVTYNRMGARKQDLSPSDLIGNREYVSYKFYAPNVVEVDKSLSGEEIFILAQTVLKNKQGEELLYYKQVEAVLYYVAYLLQQRNAFIGKQGIDLAYIRGKALNLLSDARVPDHISDNEINQVLDAKVSFGRKGYNKDFKFK